MRVVVLDTETTGLNRGRDNGASVCDGHRVIEIGCVEIVSGSVTGREFHSYINPCRDVDQKAVAVHGLTDLFLRDKPTFDVIVDSFLDFINDADAIVMHNAPFDVAFIDQEFRLLDYRKQPHALFTVVDTLELARALFPGVPNRLDDLCRRFSLPSRSGAHGALEDARILAKIYLILSSL